MRVHSRSKGHSAAAAVAYRTGLRIRDPYTGREHDYTKRARADEVLASDITGPGAMLFGDNAVIRVNAFANAIDTAERRRNSMLMRDFVTALPHELDTKQQRILLQVIAGELGERYQTPVMWSHHRPCREGDQRNSHGHIGLPTRTFEVERSRFGKKLRVLDDKRTGSEEFRIIRELVERATNRALELAGSPARVSLKRRADRLGQPNLGQACTGLERRAAKAAGIKVEGLAIGDLLTRPDYEPVTDKGKELRGAPGERRPDTRTGTAPGQRGRGAGSRLHHPGRPGSSEAPKAGKHAGEEDQGREDGGATDNPGDREDAPPSDVDTGPARTSPASTTSGTPAASSTPCAPPGADASSQG